MEEAQRILGRKESEEERLALDNAQEVLNKAGIELDIIGTRPKDR